MKATLTFDLNKPEDAESYTLMFRAGGMKQAIREFADYLRKNERYAEDRPSFELLYNKFHQIMDEHSLEIWE